MSGFRNQRLNSNTYRLFVGNPSLSEIDMLKLDLCNAEQATYEKAIDTMSRERRNSAHWCAAHKIATQSIIIIGNIKVSRRIK
jgi:hypothetical protein